MKQDAYSRRWLNAAFRRLIITLGMFTFFSGYLKAGEIRTDITYRLRTPVGQGEVIRDLALVPGDSNAWLLLQSDRPIAVFKAADLWFSDRTAIRLNMDSLKKTDPVLPVLRIVTPVGAVVRAYLVRQPSEEESRYDERPRSAKEEFTTIGMLLVIVLMLLMMVTNRRTVEGFFRFDKIFSWINREDPMASVRMTATPNLAYYGVLVLWLALLGTIYQFSTTGFPSFGELVVRCLTNVFFLLVLLFARLIILTGFPGLFGMRFGNGQQFGLVRVTTLLAFITCVILLVAFMSGGPAAVTYKLVSGLWMAGLVLYFVLVLMLMVRSAPTRALHYFSYLCMSEIIPLLLFSGLLQSQANPDLR